LGNATSTDEESFGDDGLLEYPQYTRPPLFRDWGVPDVLRSGDHGAVAAWRKAKALVRTLRQRPDLIEARGGITDDERALLERWAPGEYD
jgi:tRNA (guanine37-N1)-methyltransferase